MIQLVNCSSGILTKYNLKTVLIFGVAVVLILSSITLIWISTFRIPNLDSFEERKVIESTKIYDRTGEILLYDVSQNIKRTVVPFEEISRNIKNITFIHSRAGFISDLNMDFVSFNSI